MSANHAYLAVNVRIVFPASRNRGALMVKSVNSFKVNSSWKNLTDTAEFILSKKLSFDEKAKVFDLIKAGDPVYIEGGYNGEFNREFTGYVSAMYDDLPCVIMCEDNMYLLKQTPVNRSYKKTQLKTLLNDIVPKQFKVVCPDGIELGDLVYSDTNVVVVLEELKKWGLHSFFKENTLHCVNVHSAEDVTVKYNFHKNILPKPDLKYSRRDEKRVKVKMISRLSDGSEIEVIVGDEDGVTQKLYCTGITSVASIRKLAENALEGIKIEGYRGSFNTYGLPFAKHGYVASLKDNDNPSRSGFFYIDAVETSLNDSGAYRRQIFLSRRAAEK